MSAMHAIHELAAGQHAVFTRRQARAVGFSRGVIQQRVDSGAWLVISPTVLAIAGSPATELRAAMAAVLDAGVGAALSRDSAAALFDLPGYALLPAHDVRPRARTHTDAPLGIVHTSTRLPDHHVLAVNGIPTTTPTRLACDLSGHVHPLKFERTTETMWARRLTTWPLLSAMYEEMRGRGRPRIQDLRAYLDDRGAGYRPADSGLELRLRDILRRDGQAPLEQQVWVGNDFECLGRVDFIDRDLSLIVQVDSELFHGSLVDRERDAAQTTALAAAGYRVLRVREFEVWHDPDAVCHLVRMARREARAQLRPAA